MKVLLTEGSSLSARQTLYALAAERHVIDVCDPNPTFCIARFSSRVRKCYRCPSFTGDPAGYLQFLRDRLQTEPYDVLFPTHDQVYLLSRCRDLLARHVGLAVPDFAALERLQSKAEMVRVLNELDLPCPPTRIVRTTDELKRGFAFPSYVKLPFSTAGRGVWLIRDRDDLERWIGLGILNGAAEVLVQQPVEGTLGVVQTVFQRGQLVAGHTYLARRQGVGGSAWARVGVHQPIVLDQVARLGRHLHWHGALMFDYIWDERLRQPWYIDANPRIGETFNATLSGVNLCEALVRVAIDQQPAPSAATPGEQTHALMMSLLATAEAGGNRRQVLMELWKGWRKQGPYAGSEDELTRCRDDSSSVIPLLYMAGRLLLSPRAAARTINQAVERYALTEEAAERIRRLGPGNENGPGLSS